MVLDEAKLAEYREGARRRRETDDVAQGQVLAFHSDVVPDVVPDIEIDLVRYEDAGPALREAIDREGIDV